MRDHLETTPRRPTSRTGSFGKGALGFDRRWAVQFIPARSSCQSFWQLGVLFVVFSVSPCSGQTPETAGLAPASRQHNPFTADFNSLKSEFGHSSPAKQAVLIARGYKLRRFVDAPGEIGCWLSSIVNDKAVHPLVRDEAMRYLAAIDVQTNNLAAAKQKFESLGSIRDWSAISAPATDASDIPLGDHHAWRHVDFSAAQLWIDLSSIASANDVTYAATSVYSDTARTTALRFGADSAMTVTVNGTRVFSGDVPSAAAFDQHVVAIQLAPGWNSVLLKLTRAGEGPLRFAARITALEGGGIPLRTSAAQEYPISSVATAAAPKAIPTDLVEMARAEFASDANSAGKQQTLGLVKLEHARGSALDDLQAAARRDSSAAAWLEVAAGCEDAPCTFAALNSALLADPRNEHATLALADYYISRHQLDKARDLLRIATSLAPEDFVARECLAEVYALAGLDTLALKQTRELQALYPAPLWLRMKAAQRYASVGLTNDAVGLLRSLLRDGFDDTAARKLLGELLRRTHDDAGLQSLLKENALLNLLDSASLGSKSKSRSASGSTSAASDPDANYLENPFELAAAARRNSPSDNASAIALSDVRVERVADNGLSSVRVQQVWYIASDQGTREYASQPVQYAPATQQLRILHARVHKRDGQVVEGSDGGDSRVADPSVAMYYDVRSREVRFPDIEKGDVVELDYSITPTSSTNPYGDYFGNLVVFRTPVPERLKRYVLIAPAKRKLNVVEKRMPEGATISENNGERIYRWQARDLPALVNESRGPAVTEVAPYVHVSSFASWSELGEWYAEMLRPQLRLDANLRDVAARIVAGQNNEFDKINAIYQFVLRNTHYVGLEFGIYSYKPYPVTLTYARRYGDCKDKASLMIALLREAGIDADFALLRTRRMGEIDPRAASIALFNHAIVYLPKWDLWLDGTAEYFNSRELPVDDQGAMALVVAADGASSLRLVPITRPEDNYTRRTVHATLQADGAIRFQGDTYTRGEDAPGLRREYESTDTQRDSVRNSLAQVFPGVRVDDVRVRDGNDPEPGVKVDFSGTLDNFHGKRTVSLATSWMEHSYVQPLAPLASRTQDLNLPAPWTTEEELHFQLPATAQIVSLPANTELNTRFGTAHIRYERHGREIVIRTSLQFRALRVAPGDYDAFRDFCRSVESAFLNEVKVNIGGS